MKLTKCDVFVVSKFSQSVFWHLFGKIKISYLVVGCIVSYWNEKQIKIFWNIYGFYDELCRKKNYLSSMGAALFLLDCYVTVNLPEFFIGLYRNGRIRAIFRNSNDVSGNLDFSRWSGSFTLNWKTCVPSVIYQNSLWKPLPFQFFSNISFHLLFFLCADDTTHPIGSISFITTSFIQNVYLPITK